MENRFIFRAGTSGLVLAERNKQAFPEAWRNKSRLAWYAAQFNTVEVNSSFYKVPMAATFTKWTNIVPEAFQFTLKLWRGITHNRAFEFNLEDIDQFMKAANCIGRKKGCLLIQLPPSATLSKVDRLEKILERVQMNQSAPPWKIAVEFRHPSWYTETTTGVLKKYNAVIVCHDMPASGTMTPSKHGDFVYIRFHGVRGDYKGSYSTALLEEYAGKIRSWLQEGKDVYAYFNNTIGDAVANLKTLVRLVDLP